MADSDGKKTLQSAVVVVQNVIRMSDIHGSQLLSDFQSFFSP